MQSIRRAGSNWSSLSRRSIAEEGGDVSRAEGGEEWGRTDGVGLGVEGGKRDTTHSWEGSELDLGLQGT